MEELNIKSVEDLRESAKMPIVAVLQNVRSAYNVGSIFRTADAFLIEAIYLCGYTAYPPHKEIRKTALGADETVHWKHFNNVNSALEELRQQGYRIFAVEQAINSLKLDGIEQFEGKLAVVFGNEVTGVEQTTIENCDGCLEIPQFGMKHSLNVSVAAGVVLWELVRNKLQKAKGK